MLLAGGGAFAQPPEYMPHKEKRLTDAKAAAEEADFRVFQTHHGGSHDTEGFASLHPRLRATRSARAFDLSGRAAVRHVIIILSEAARVVICWEKSPSARPGIG